MSALAAGAEFSPNADVLFGLLAHQELAGIEQSYKVYAGTVLANRFLLGVDRSEIDDEQLFAICTGLAMPAAYMEEFRAALPDANLILFGFEESQQSCVYKVYLEYWDKVTAEVRARPGMVEPALLHLGYKWDPVDTARRAIARYVCYPLVTVRGIVARLHGMYGHHHDSTSCAVATGIVESAERRAAGDLFIYMETTEEGNPRRSFDVNLYKADLRMRDIQPYLTRMFRHYCIPSVASDALIARASDRTFGHLAGGLDREGRDFLTV
jgi:hypothetical protein